MYYQIIQVEFVLFMPAVVKKKNRQKDKKQETLWNCHVNREEDTALSSHFDQGKVMKK